MLGSSLKAELGSWSLRLIITAGSFNTRAAAVAVANVGANGRGTMSLAPRNLSGALTILPTDPPLARTRTLCSSALMSSLLTSLLPMLSLPSTSLSALGSTTRSDSITPKRWNSAKTSNRRNEIFMVTTTYIKSVKKSPHHHLHTVELPW